MFKLKYIAAGELVEFTVSELLEEINRDRSDGWSEYDMNSTLGEITEAVEEFTEYTFNV
jgi:hypothetical protein